MLVFLFFLVSAHAEQFVNLTLTASQNQIQFGNVAPNITILNINLPSSPTTLHVPDITGTTDAEFVLTKGKPQTIYSKKSFVGGLNAGRPDLQSVFVGAGAGNLAIATGTDRVAIGERALASDVDSYGTVAIGSFAAENLQSSPLGPNTVIGLHALRYAVNVNSNTAVGSYAMRDSTSSDSVAIGNGALRQAAASKQVAVGNQALGSVVTGGLNTALGYSAASNVLGSENVHVGAFTDSQVPTTGSRNVLVGARTSATNFNDCIVLGYNAQASANNQLVLNGPIVSNTATAGSITPPSQVVAYLPIKIGTTVYHIPLYDP